MKFTSPTKPMVHQLEALRRRALRPEGYDDVFADVAEMGCGKSKVILDEWQQMVADEYVSDLLVVAPAGCYRNWFQDKNETNLSEMRTHLDPRLLKRVAIGGWGNSAKARGACQALLKVRDRPRALFVNVEALSAGEKAYSLCMQFMRSTRRGVMFVIDESTVIRASKSIRTRTIVHWPVKSQPGKDYSLRPLAKVRRILTGLMTPKSPMDLFWQFYFLDPRIIGYDSFTVFKRYYAQVKTACYEKNHVIEEKLRQSMGLKKEGVSYRYLKEKLAVVHEIIGSRGRPLNSVNTLRDVKAELTIAIPLLVAQREKAVECIIKLGGWIKHHEEIKEFRNLDELRAKIAPFQYRVLKSECMDLPPKVWQPREVELTLEQKRMYKEMLESATTELEGQHITAEAVMGQIAKLHQIAIGHARSETKEIVDIPSNRIKSLMELLEDFEGKAVIWTHYRHEVERIVEALREEYGEDSVAQFHGGNLSTRAKEEAQFLGNPNCRWMVATQAAGGKGNTWVNASLAVYYSNSYDLEHRMQSEDRNHRKGQTAECVTYVDLITRGTVEEKVVQALRDKLDISTIITGENYREWLI